jgi:hypothetical protein
MKPKHGNSKHMIPLWPCFAALVRQLLDFTPAFASG